MCFGGKGRKIVQFTGNKKLDSEEIYQKKRDFLNVENQNLYLCSRKSTDYVNWKGIGKTAVAQFAGIRTIGVCGRVWATTCRQDFPCQGNLRIPFHIPAHWNLGCLASGAIG